MIGLTIDKLSSMTKEDAAALRAIADVYHPAKRNDNMDVSMLKVGIQRGMPGALTTLEELNAAIPRVVISGDGSGMKLPEIDTTAAQVGSLASIGGTLGTLTTPAQVASLGEQFLASVQKTAERAGLTVTAKLHPDDNPAAGAPDQHALADQVFSGGAIPASENVEPDPVVVFSGGAEQPAPNVLAATPTPPPLPLATPQTLPQQSPAATNVSPPPPPPPAPAPDAASAGVATTSPAPNNVELDAAGLPWDARIHASTKTKTAKNVWTRRRGVEDSLVTQVEAQLRTAMNLPVPAAPAAAAWPFPTDSSSVTGVPPAPTFPTLMTFITERIGAGTLNQAQVTAAVQAVGLESLNLVMARVDLIPAIMDELRKVAP